MARHIPETSEGGRNQREDSLNRPTVPKMPGLLKIEISRMRREPSEFTVYAGAKCKFCYKRTAFDLSHANSQAAGSWCPEHGWLFFDSVKIRPVGEEYVPKKRKPKAGMRAIY